MTTDRPLTPKQEKFAQEYTVSKSMADAYRKAYDIGKCKEETIYTNACKLMKNTKIAQRIQEIQNNQAKKYQITRDMITEDLLMVAQQAKLLRDKDTGEIAKPTLLMQNAMNMAKLHGLIVDPSESVGALTFNKMDNITINNAAVVFDVGQEVKGDV